MLSRLVPSLPVSDAVKYALLFLSVPVCTVLIAHVSYRYFERYFLKWKENYAVVKTVSADKDARRTLARYPLAWVKATVKS